MPEFLANNNSCGQCVLNLVARGNAIIAELKRLADFIPAIFRPDCKDEGVIKYGILLCDFTYFKSPELFESKIENNNVLQDLDDELKDNHLSILTRFYLAFESVHKYVLDLLRYLDDLGEGIFIQQNLETVFSDEDGKQLLCEALYLYGVMLLVVEREFDGNIREKILVSYYRYSGKAHGDSQFDDVCKLLRSTGYCNSTPSKRPANYPEEYFGRVKIHADYIDMVIGRLRSDDVYNQVATYPLPEQRSIALATQASMLYVCLYFCPSVLMAQPVKMREMVDKYFPDNWVINIYMGYIVNLLDMWEPYKAAKQALSNIVQHQAVKQLALAYKEKFANCTGKCAKLLQKGSVDEETVLSQSNKLIGVLRECNITLRWLVLHTGIPIKGEVGKKSKQIREQIMSELQLGPVQVLDLLLKTAELELKIKEIFKQLLKDRDLKWSTCKSECYNYLIELSEAFSGTKPLTRVQKNDTLEKWFREISAIVGQLECQDLGELGRKLVQLIQALEEVQEFHQLESNVQVKQFLQECQGYLHQMLRIINVREETLIQLHIISDLSYAWEWSDHYTVHMQEMVRADPYIVSQLRASFIKLSSALDLPLLRINQAHSPDMVSVSQYYSNELVSYVHKVLQVIPASMFSLMEDIISLQTHKITELPTRLDKDKLKDLALLEERYQVAKLTHGVSVFTEGILSMKTTLVGIVRMDPKQLLENGIRKELVKQISHCLNVTLVFSIKNKLSDLASRISILIHKINGFKRSFEYIQDYVNICGLKLWQEELSRIIGYNVEQECNAFLRNKIQDWQSIYQSKSIPIPVYPPVDSTSVNFIGRLARELMKVTDPRTSVMIADCNAWFDLKSQQEVIGPKLFHDIHLGLSTAGLTGLDRLFSFMIVKELQSFAQLTAATLQRDKTNFELFSGFLKQLQPLSGNIVNPGKVYPQIISKSSKYLISTLDIVLKIGQLQLLKKYIAYELRSSCSYDSKTLSLALESFNESVLLAVDKTRETCEPDTANLNLLMQQVSSYLHYTGMSEPLSQIYITTKSIPHVALYLFLLTISQAHRLVYISPAGSRKIQEPLDHVVYVFGVLTVIKQFHSSVADQFLSLLAQYVRSHVEAAATYQRSGDTSLEAHLALMFLRHYMRYGKIELKEVTCIIPEYILSSYRK